MDRFGHQTGGFTQSPYGEELGHVATHSDILYACKRGDGWIMEATFSNDPGCDTGIRAYIRGEERADEYFGEDTYRARYALHGDVGFGAGVAIPGRESVIHAVFDPIYAVDSRGDTTFDGGLHWYSVADGHWRKSIRVYNNITGIVPEEGIFAKANGLGDIVALTDIPPVEIGNRVWLDSNRDGIQSPSESGIADVTVELICPGVGADGRPGTADDGAVIATAETDSEGHYYFSSADGTDTGYHKYGLNLVTAAACLVRIPNAAGAAQQTPLIGLQLTEPNDQTPTTSGNDDNDSDGMANGMLAIVEFAIGAPGANNHTYDFGFFLEEPLHSLGNQVWLDSNDDARINSGESGVSGVALTLYDGNGAVVDQTKTVANGLYLFTGLAAGDYQVGVDASNFAPGAIFEGCRSSNEALDEDNPNLDFDDNDNGLLTAGALRSASVTLGSNEPLSENPDNDPTTPDNRENLTVDFGIFCSEPPILFSLGNQVWLDSNDDAVVNPGEVGINGVKVTLYAADDRPLVHTTTDADGLYLFTDLPAGRYTVGVDPSNFAVGNILAGCRTSNEMLDEDNPDLDLDNNDNGRLRNGVVRSDLVTLAPGEPEHELPDNDFTTPDSQENLALDFGIFCGHSLGNQVWFDVNNNTLIDGGEVGIDNIALTLFSTNGTADQLDDTVISQTTTTNGGLYLFDELVAGDYYVQLDAENFINGGPLQSCKSSNEWRDEDDPNTDIDNNDNGHTVGVLIQSGVVRLGDNEPTGEAPDNDQMTLDQRENLTVDFGCYLPVSLGNRVWFDDGRSGGLADNGLMDGGEPGVANVVMGLLDGEKRPIVDDNGRPLTTTTDIAGYYLFTDLLPGEYVVQVLPSNFQPGGALAGFLSSSTTEEDPNQDEDTNDNGVDSTTPDLDGVCSNVLTLTYAAEPGQEPDPGQLPDRALDSNSNLTVDFGFVASHPTTLAEATEPAQQYRLFLPQVAR
ncbi:MAG: SdrD B-like domain-containing protein [Caldilineaceae bacterium]